MTQRIDPTLLHPDRRFFLDYLAGEPSALCFFEHAPSEFQAACSARASMTFPRATLASLLRQYNDRLDGSAETQANIDRLAAPGTVCVIGGQQAGFLGGPLLTVYKIRSVLHAASRLADRLHVPVVPIFWLASEDHDFTEINRLRFLDHAGDLHAISFDWDQRGLPIERLPITPAVRTATDEAIALIPDTDRDARSLFLADPSDDYATWHARIWSRLFGAEGLILVEPRTIRELAGSFFHRALRDEERITSALVHAARDLESSGYPIPIDPTHAGRLFLFSDDGRRTRVVDPSDHVDRAEDQPQRYSPDALLRPLLVDSLFPTIASILGPSEIAYQSMIRPLYELFGVAQPLLYPRHGFTLISRRQTALLEQCGLDISDLFSSRFNPAAVAEALASPTLLDLFATRRSAVRSELDPLGEPLAALDPGLPIRLRQTVDRIDQQIVQLQQRALRTDLARRGISVRELHRLTTEVLPTGKPQERVLSMVHVVAQHGLHWLSELEPSAPPDEYAHYVRILGDPHG